MFSSSDIPFTTGTYKPLGSGEFGNVRRHLNADSGYFIYDMLWIVSSRLESCIDNGGCTAIKEPGFPDFVFFPRCGEDLVVSNDEDCSKLLQTGWKTITVNHRCVDFTGDWIISEEYSCLQKLEVKQSNLDKLNSLTISSMIMIEMIWFDLPQFTNLTVEKYSLSIAELTLSSVLIDKWFNRSSWTDNNSFGREGIRGSI